MKIGRNDPCPCGSGVKYKKCCIPKYDKPIPAPVQTFPEFYDFTGRASDLPFEDFESFAERAWNTDKLRAMSDSEILAKLSELGFRTDQRQFVEEAAGHISADNVVDKWTSLTSTSINDVLDEDFPLLAAQELWDRWLPDQFSLHRLEERLDDFLYDNQTQRFLEPFWDIWMALKEHILIPYGLRSFRQFEERFDFHYDMDALFFESEGDMVEECQERQKEDPDSWDRLIMLYRDMLDHLTDMDEDNRLDLRRSYAEAHFYKGDINAANALFQQLIEEHPEWVWGYIGWGDLYNPEFTHELRGDKGEALRLYRLGIGKASYDQEVLEERIKDLSAG